MWDLIGAKNGEREREREREREKMKRIGNDIKRESVCVKRTKWGFEANGNVGLRLIGAWDGWWVDDVELWWRRH